MNIETSPAFASGMTNTNTNTNGTMNTNADGTVRRVAVKAHEAVDKLEQTLGAGTEKVMGLQEEYGAKCREQIKASPLVSVAAAFGAGVIFSKLFLR